MGRSGSAGSRWDGSGRKESTLISQFSGARRPFRLTVRCGRFPAGRLDGVKLTIDRKRPERMRHIGQPCTSRREPPAYPAAYPDGMPDPAEAAGTEASGLPRPAAIIFDLDGTLIDTVGTRIDAWLEVFDRFGLPARRDQVAQLIGIDGRRLAHEIAAAAGQPIDDERAEEIDKACGEIFEGRNRHPQPLPGVTELEAAIRSADIAWAIATSSRREQVATSVRALGLRSEPTIIDGSQVEHAKPEPDLLLLAARQLGVDPGRCWYVGDSTWDMVSAVAAGMLPVGVTAGSAVSKEGLRSSGAQAVFPTLDALAAALAIESR
jgi:HAD superfamily hydrolase (TIGR01509 family)